MESIIQSLKSQDFARLKIGIGRPGKEDVVDYVLGRFTTAELEILKQIMPLVVKGIQLWCSRGLETAMNAVNSTALDSFPERDEGQKEV